MANRSRLTRGQTIRPCGVCERNCRPTLSQNSHDPICDQCFELAGFENQLLDGYSLEGGEATFVRSLIAEIAEKGGNVEKVRAEFTELMGHI